MSKNIIKKQLRIPICNYMQQGKTKPQEYANYIYIYSVC